MTKAASSHVAIIYDRVNSWGGAERVLLELHRLYPQAPLLTAVYAPKRAAWANGWKVRPSWLQKVPGAVEHHQWFGWVMPAVFETMDLEQYDTIISVTSEAAKGVITQPHQRHICYLLTPTRYLWSHYDSYTAELGALAVGAQPVMAALRRWDRVAASRPDIIVPISQLVKKRAEQYYERPIAEPIYPPVTVLPDPQMPAVVPPSPFLLSWGRHVRYKAMAEIIAAAGYNHHNLVLAGAGPDTSRLRRIAYQFDPWQQHIFFVGTVRDAELSWYLDHAQGAIFPQEEDFGIAPMEALQRGCPVLLNAHSGAAELFTPNQDGIVVQCASMMAVARGMQQLTQTSWLRAAIAARHQHHDAAQFARRWQQQIMSIDKTGKEKI